MKNICLSAKGLCKSFALGGNQVHVLQHVDLELYEGDFTVVWEPAVRESPRCCTP